MADNYEQEAQFPDMGGASFAFEEVATTEVVDVVETKSDERRTPLGRILSRVSMCFMLGAAGEAALATNSASAEETALGTLDAAEVSVNVMPGTTVEIKDKSIIIDRGHDPSANLGQTITAPGIIINTIPETTPYSSKLPNILLDYVCPPGGFVKEDGAIGYDPSKPQRAIGISGIFSRNSGEPGEMTVEMSLVGHEGKGVVKNIPAASGAAVFQSIDNLSPNETLQYTLNVQMPNKKQITVKGDFPNNCEAPKTLIENKVREREASKGTVATTTTVKTATSVKPAAGTIRSTTKAKVSTKKSKNTARRKATPTKKKAISAKKR